MSRFSARGVRQPRGWPVDPRQYPLSGQTRGPVYLPPEYAYMQRRAPNPQWPLLFAVWFMLGGAFGSSVLLLFSVAAFTP